MQTSAEPRPPPPLTQRAPRPAVVAGVVVPAHDEGRVLRRNLHALLSGLPAGALDVVVVCNGCTDDTAEQARTVPGVRVVEVPVASKARAVEVGNQVTGVFPRVHLDADVRITGSDLLRLVEPLATGRALAAGPARRLDLAGSAWPVRAYYRVWQRLPQVEDGLFGRGVIALSEEGQARVDRLPRLMSDDLAVSEAFAAHERVVVPEAAAVIVAPRTTRDLLRRRVRVVTGNAQADSAGVPRQATNLRTLAGLARHDPLTGLRVPLFLGIGLAARWTARRAVRAGDFTTWLRDESSRA